MYVPKTNLKQIEESLEYLMNHLNYPISDSLGTKRWVDKNTKRHREDGPAVIYADGSKSWWIHGKFHREDGPALIRFDGSEVWFFEGRRHREDGPAVIYANGKEEYWIDGRELNKEEWKEYVSSKNK